MRLVNGAVVTISLTISPYASLAQEEANGPVILSERVQAFAQEYGVAERLGIDWDEAGSEATSKYIGFLSATEVIAQELARADDRQVPSDEDYQTAFFLQCIWPPNKPPSVERFWALQEPSFYSAAIREEIRRGLQFQSAPLSELIATVKGGQEPTTAIEAVSENPDSYFFENFFDPRLLEDFQQ